MFESPYRDTTFVYEARVVSVDHIRGVCTVRNFRGSLVEGIRWLQPLGATEREGFHTTPRRGETVVVDTSTGYPMITGSLGQRETGDANPSSLVSSTVAIDTGNRSIWRGGARLNRSRPRDQLPGDKSLVGEAGNLLAVLRAGSVLAKSSDMCQLLLSPINDLFRVVSRNWEIHNDVFTDVGKNLKGTAYRFTGYSDTPANVRAGVYKYYETRGAAEAGEALRDAYAGGQAASGSSLAKRVVTDGTAPLFTESLNMSGHQTTRIQDAGGSTYSVKTETNGSIRYETKDGKVAHINMDGRQLEVVWDDKVTTFDSKGILIKDGDISKVEMTSSKMTVEWNGRTADFSNSGIMLQNGAQTLELGPSTSTLTAGGHSVRISPSGIDLI